MSELDPGSYRQPGQPIDYVMFDDPQWLSREIKRTQEMIRELPEWLGQKPQWKTEWPGTDGWFWFCGELKRGRQVFSRDMMAVYVEDTGLFKGPRGLAFFAHQARGMWLELSAPRKPTAMEIASAIGIKA